MESQTMRGIRCVRFRSNYVGKNRKLPSNRTRFLCSSLKERWKGKRSLQYACTHHPIHCLWLRSHEIGPCHDCDVSKTMACHSVNHFSIQYLIALCVFFYLIYIGTSQSSHYFLFYVLFFLFVFCFTELCFFVSVFSLIIVKVAILK